MWDRLKELNKEFKDIKEHTDTHTKCQKNVLRCK